MRTELTITSPALVVEPTRTAGLTRAERTLDAAHFERGFTIGFRQIDKDERALVAAARRTYGDLRESVGYKNASAALLTSGAAQYKLGKNSLPSFGLMLTPERGIMANDLAWIRERFGLSGAWNICPLASKGCAAACLSRSGQSGMPAQQLAQAVRTAFLLGRPWEFGLILGAELRAAVKRYGPINLRLNTTSDLRWELIAPGMLETLAGAGVTLYDYTAWAPEDRSESAIYGLTYSAKEPAHTSNDYLTGILESGSNVAMPFDTGRGQALPATWRGFPVIDGDESDERRKDPRGVIVGLRAKGYEWKRDPSGFIRSAEFEGR